MTLATYINDLLYRYDCVIVPDFGGFVTNRIGAKMKNHIFTPPTKQITFNSLLKHNDGLLANYIASSENISFEKANTVISLAVIKWQNELQTKAVIIENVGNLSLSEGKKIIFEPIVTVNYLTESFGLATIETSAILRLKEQAKPLVPVLIQSEKKGVATFIKYAATVAVLLTLGYTGYNGHQNEQQNKVVANQQIAIQKKIQAATFVISNPLPTINLNVVREISKPFHVVAGAFQFVENAERKVKLLRAKGFDAKIIGVNEWGLTQVTFNSFASRNEATNHLYKIQKTISSDAWLLIRTLK